VSVDAPIESLGVWAFAIPTDEPGADGTIAWDSTTVVVVTVGVAHLEYFHDHARCDRILFDGVLDPVGGVLGPDPDRPGFGLELKLAARRAVRRLAPDRRQDLDAVAERVRRVKALEPLELRVVDDVEAGRRERGAPGLEVVDDERGMRRASRRERLLHAEMHLEATA
jgi:hypothetical protein